MLSLKDIAVNYGGVKALKGISLDVEEGAITCLIGANGAGKSTALRAISGMVPLTAGEIWFQRRRIDGMEPEEIVEMGIGHVPEGKKLFLEMSVQDNLLTGAYLRNEKELIEQDLHRVYRYFPLLGIAANKPASKMSGGEQQMIAIGRGLMGAPRLLLLDEPSLGLSPILTREVGSIIKKIADEGVSILLIEQNAMLALQLAKKCYVLETGSIALEGTSQDLQNNEHVRAAYLGIACTLEKAIPGISSSPFKDEKSSGTKMVSAEDVKWQNVKTEIFKSGNHLPEKEVADNRKSAFQAKEYTKPDKIQYGSRLSGILTGKSTFHDIDSKDILTPEGVRSTEAWKEPLKRLDGKSRADRPPRIVKKIFSPKEV